MRERLANAWRASAAASWWSGKAAYEQLVYGGLAAVAMVVLLWLGLWRPLADWQAQETARLQRAQVLLAWVSANEAQARAAAGAAAKDAPADAKAVIPAITQAAAAAGVRLSRLQPESGGGVSVFLQQQSFAKVVALIAQLQEGSGVVVELASIDAHRTPGFVDAQLRLSLSR